MANNNVKNEQVNAQATPVVNGVPEVQQPVQQEIPVVMVAAAPQQPVVEEKPNWFKKHWKAILTGAAAVATAVGSGVVAYNKGKNVGMNAPVQMPSDYDNSLNPNI